MNSNSDALNAVNKVEAAYDRPIKGLVICSSGLSYLGGRSVVPATGWEKELMALGLAVAIYLVITVLINAQKYIYPALKTKSKLADWLLVTSFAVILFISGSTATVGLINELAAVRAMEDGQNHSETLGGQAKASAHAVTSISPLLISYKEKAENLSKRAISGELTGVKGKGPVAKRYATIADELESLASMVEENMSKGEPLAHAMDSAAARMGSIIKRDIPLDDKIAQFEMAQRDYSNNYTRLIGLNTADQLRAGLNGLTDSSIAESATDRISRKALIAADEFAQSIVTDIGNYLETKVEPLPPLDAYEQPSPSIASFIYARYYIPQVGLAFGPDLTLIILVLLRIAASRDGEDEAEHNPTYSLKDLQVLLGALNEVNDVRRDAISLQDKIREKRQ